VGAPRKENYRRQTAQRASKTTHTHKRHATRAPAHTTPAQTDLLRIACAPTYTHSKCFCVIRICISSSSSSRERPKFIAAVKEEASASDTTPPPQCGKGCRGYRRHSASALRSVQSPDTKNYTTTPEFPHSNSFRRPLFSLHLFLFFPLLFISRCLRRLVFRHGKSSISTIRRR